MKHNEINNQKLLVSNQKRKTGQSAEATDDNSIWKDGIESHLHGEPKNGAHGYETRFDLRAVPCLCSLDIECEYARRYREVAGKPLQTDKVNVL